MLHCIENKSFCLQFCICSISKHILHSVVLFIKCILHPVSFSAGSTAVKRLIDMTSCDARQTPPLCSMRLNESSVFLFKCGAPSHCLVTLCCHGALPCTAQGLLSWRPSEWQLGPGALVCLRGRAATQLYARLGVSVFRVSLRLSAYADLFYKL